MRKLWERERAELQVKKKNCVGKRESRVAGEEEKLRCSQINERKKI